VVAGDALVDLAPTPTATGGTAYQPRPGGSCLNVAAGLGRLGVPASLLARISDDHCPDLLRAHLAESGTRLTHVLATSDPASLAAVRLCDDASAAYPFHANGAADRGLRPECRDTLPNAGQLKASEEDLAWLHPGEPYVLVAEGWPASGAKLVLVTLGSRGAWAAGGTARVHMPAPVVEAVDTVGAGDAFTAGVLAHLHRSGRLAGEGVAGPCPDELTGLPAYALGVAAETGTRVGAQPPFHREGLPIPS
ncbi:PfkB family carbohydrate kinase, partial [Streptomyces sp. NPDC058964]|uniref:PfkB family carbohydrate kinase n=1 Tax=Streptomyces sp. NPDC058964 TaxID=3346681 RepID=UPI0036AD1904